MGIMITYHGYNNPIYNAHKNMGAHYTWQNPVFKKKKIKTMNNKMAINTYQ